VHTLGQLITTFAESIAGRPWDPFGDVSLNVTPNGKCIVVRQRVPWGTKPGMTALVRPTRELSDRLQQFLFGDGRAVCMKIT
jgi:hypothetical protein